MNLFLFLAGMFLVTFILGQILEKIRIPWIFSALLTGLGLAFYNPFGAVTSSPEFVFLANLGMYFLLFIIGFEIDFVEIKKHGGFIIKSTLVIILAEAFFGMLFVHYVFGVSWLISTLVGLSFATVGEAVLIPILDEFKITKTPLGQTIIGIGVLDDVIEIITVLSFIAILGIAGVHTDTNITSTVVILISMFILAYLLTEWKHDAAKIHFKGIASFFLFVIFFIFLFIGIGNAADTGILGALLAGMALKNFIPRGKWKIIDSEIRTMAYGFFAPFFFLWIGLQTDTKYLIAFPMMIIILLLVTGIPKIIASYFVGRNVLGKNNALILGISLTVKFSTSIVIIKLLLDKGLIPISLYSLLIAVTVVEKFIVPFLLSNLIPKLKVRKAMRVSRG